MTLRKHCYRYVRTCLIKLYSSLFVKFNSTFHSNYCFLFSMTERVLNLSILFIVQFHNVQFYFRFPFLLFFVSSHCSSLIRSKKPYLICLFRYTFFQLTKEKEIYSTNLSDERIHNEQCFQEFKSAAIKRQVGPSAVDWHWYDCFYFMIKLWSTCWNTNKTHMYTPTHLHTLTYTHAHQHIYTHTRAHTLT